MQVSQTLHMAIELYDQINYLLILDHYDDITLFDLDANPLVVSYYQMKTSDKTITIDSAIKEDWLAKMYAQLCRNENWIVKELGLITNTPLEISYNVISQKGKAYNTRQSLSADRTSFTELHQSIQDKIRKDIASKCRIPEDQVDLTKYAHIHTTLTIERHKDLVEKEMEDFLYGKYPRITVDTVKAIYSSLIDILAKRQGYERMSPDATLENVRKHKGFTKTELDRVIDKAMLLSLPSFEDVIKYGKIGNDKQNLISLPYVQILADSNNPKDGSFPRLFSETIEAMDTIKYNDKDSIWDYAQKIACSVSAKEPTLCIPYNNDYIAVLTICLLINQSRRKP